LFDAWPAHHNFAVSLSETWLAILRVFEDADGPPLGPTDVADILDQPANTIKRRMYQMSKDGDLRVESRGRYIGTHNLHNLHNLEEEKVTEVMEVMTPRNQNGNDAVSEDDLGSIREVFGDLGHFQGSKRTLVQFQARPSDERFEHLCVAVCRAARLDASPRWEDYADEIMRHAGVPEGEE
jgi:hypothetical protein